MVLHNQHNSLLVAQLIKFFATAGFLKTNMVFFSSCFTKEKANEELGGLLQFSRIEHVILSQLSFFLVDVLSANQALPR